MNKLKYFSAPWCGPCKVFRPVINELIDEGFDVEIINVDEDQELTISYNVMSVPHLIVENKCSESDDSCDEKVLHRVMGGASKEQIKQLLTK